MSATRIWPTTIWATAIWATAIWATTIWATNKWATIDIMNTRKEIMVQSILATSFKIPGTAQNTTKDLPTIPITTPSKIWATTKKTGQDNNQNKIYVSFICI